MRPPALTHPSSAAVFLGDCLDVLAEIPDNSVDAIVCDPPYGLGFMGKEWDDLPPGLPWAQECLRVLKPGGHLLAFGGTRTWHRLAVAVEDAGFEVRDSIAWLYGSGFPKSLDVSKAIDKLDASAERRSRALEFTAWFRTAGLTQRQVTDLLRDAGHITENGTMAGHFFAASYAGQPAVATAAIFDTLRPHLPEVPERIEELVRQRTVESENFKARAVVGERTTGIGTGRGAVSYIADSENKDVTAPHTPAAQQWAGWGTALKPAFEPIVVARKPLVGTVAANVLAHGTGALNIDASRVGDAVGGWGGGGSALYEGGLSREGGDPRPVTGRWPANVLLDGDAAAELDEQGPITKGVAGGMRQIGGNVTFTVGEEINAKKFTPSSEYVRDEGGPSRYFPTFRYNSKAPTRERPTVVAEDGTKTAHPTVKPLALMRWLVRLVTPPGGTVLDTFAGSGATVEAAIEEGFYALGIEREESYLPLIQVRLDRVTGPEASA